MRRLFLAAKAVPRWVILITDLVINVSTFSISYFITKQFEFPMILRGHFFYYTGLYSAIVLVVFYGMRIHTGLIRYSNIRDMFRILVAVVVSSLLYIPAAKFLIDERLSFGTLNIYSVLLINVFIAFSCLFMIRAGIRALYYSVKMMSTAPKEFVLVYGSNNEAILAKHAIEASGTNKMVVAGFLENKTSKINSYIQQIRIYHVSDLKRLKEKRKITKLILLHDMLGANDQKMVVEKCLQLGIKVLTVPPSGQWVYGKLSLSQMQELRIEDLLQRPTIQIDNQGIFNELENKCVLITGVAGSIGSEIVRQVLSYKPSTIVLCDQAETPLHELHLELTANHPEVNFRLFIASVRDRNRMEVVFRETHPQIVFHAAAYKHVPLMETHPAEAVLTNVLDTKVMADLSVYFNVQKFVMISTDKAVNPSNIMGTTKRLAEMYVQALSNIIAQDNVEELHDIPQAWSKQFITKAIRSNTKFITTRFGNVLGSNGSVIPLFRSQIEKGGPVTVTHPQITRYFMTIPEAVRLVLEAARMGNGSEIFIFDMGSPVKIVDLAHKMIRLVGLVPDEDIKVVFTGLRPGEKLYEELLNKEETTLPTHHEKIKIAKVKPCSFEVMMEIEQLIHISRQNDNYATVRKMKQLVPEFKSNNSKYEELDEMDFLRPVIVKKAMAT